MEKDVSQERSLGGGALRSAAYAEFLFSQFVKCRAFPGWPDLYECHDEEDRAYFWMLDGEVEKGRITLEQPK